MHDTGKQYLVNEYEYNIGNSSRAKQHVTRVNERFARVQTVSSFTVQAQRGQAVFRLCVIAQTITSMSRYFVAQQQTLAFNPAQLFDGLFNGTN